MPVYIASEEDLSEIILMALEIPKELPVEGFPEPTKEKVAQYIFEQFSEYPIFIFKDKPQGKILGMLGVYITDIWWSDTELLTDYMFYVKPKYRKKGVAKQLIQAEKDFAQLNKLNLLSQFWSVERTNIKERLFEKLGFTKIGFMGFINNG